MERDEDHPENVQEGQEDEIPNVEPHDFFHGVGDGPDNRLVIAIDPIWIEIANVFDEGNLRELYRYATQTGDNRLADNRNFILAHLHMLRAHQNGLIAEQLAEENVAVAPQDIEEQDDVALFNPLNQEDENEDLYIPHVELIDPNIPIFISDDEEEQEDFEAQWWDPMWALEDTEDSSSLSLSSTDSSSWDDSADRSAPTSGHSSPTKRKREDSCEPELRKRQKLEDSENTLPSTSASAASRKNDEDKDFMNVAASSSGSSSPTKTKRGESCESPEKKRKSEEQNSAPSSSGSSFPNKTKRGESCESPKRKRKKSEEQNSAPSSSETSFPNKTKGGEGCESQKRKRRRSEDEGSASSSSGSSSSSPPSSDGNDSNSDSN